MTTPELSEHTKAVVLLCSSVGLDSGTQVKPFGPAGWHSLSARFDKAGIVGPDSLIGMTANDIARDLSVDHKIADQAATLLERAGRFTLDLERIRSWGIWVLSELDTDYPVVLRERLGNKAPPLLFGAGDVALLGCTGVAVVGSRRADQATIAFARAFGRRAAELGIAVVSGAARGVDEETMLAALGAEGVALGVVADSLERLIRRKAWRQKLVSGELLLVSEHHPSRRFDAGWAMQRNRVVYCLSQAAVVVAADAGRGGTWDGAVKNLKAGWVPLYVRAGETAPAGNARLLSEGAVRELPDDGRLAAETLTSGFDSAQTTVGVASAPDERRGGVQEPSQTEVGVEVPAATDDQSIADSTVDVYLPLVPMLVEAAVETGRVRSVADRLGVPLKQASVWLTRAVGDGYLSKNSKGFALGDRDAATASEVVFTNMDQLHHFAVDAVDALVAPGFSKSRAVSLVSQCLGVQRTLAEQWLGDAADARCQPLFIVEPQEQPPGDD